MSKMKPTKTRISSEWTGDNVIIVPHMQVSPNDLHLYNRAVTSGGGLLADKHHICQIGLQSGFGSHLVFGNPKMSEKGLWMKSRKNKSAADLQKATVSAQAFYSEDAEGDKRSKAPWILKRLYDWSHRAKTRQIAAHVDKALQSDRKDTDFCDPRLKSLMTQTWKDMFTNYDSLEPRRQKQAVALWEIFHTELNFLQRQLLTLRNVFKEPLKECQVEGCLLSVEPDLLFGNLEELCQISHRFCQLFDELVTEWMSDGSHGPTGILTKVFDKFSRGPSTISAYQAYCLNYKATMEYLETVRHKDERFIEFEKLCMVDSRCSRLQLEDLLISPLHRITRLPILLKEVARYTDDVEEKAAVDKIIDSMQEALRSIDDSIQWLHNFERIQELQNLLIWPPISDIDSRCYIPDFLKLALSRQFCENLLAHPRRKLIHEGTLTHIEHTRHVEVYAFLFNDMLLLTKVKKGQMKVKKPGGKTVEQSVNRYVVQRQPVPLDSCVFCDVAPQDVTMANLKNTFVIIHLTRFYQIIGVYTFQAASKEIKESWIEKFQESIEHYESIQLKDMLKCSPLLETGVSLASSRVNNKKSPTTSPKTSSPRTSTSTPRTVSPKPSTTPRTIANGYCKRMPSTTKSTGSDSPATLTPNMTANRKTHSLRETPTTPVQKPMMSPRSTAGSVPTIDKVIMPELNDYQTVSHV